MIKLKHIIQEDFFSFGRKKEDQKAKEKAMSEIDNYSFQRLFFEPAADKMNDPEAIKKLVKIKLIDAKNFMPTVATLLPHLFEMSTTADNGSIFAMLKYNNNMLKGRIPATFSFILDRNNSNLMHNDQKCREEMKSILKIYSGK